MISRASTDDTNGVDRILQCHEDSDSRGVRIKTPHPPNPDNVRIARRDDTPIDRQTDAAIDRQPPAPIDRRAPITYRVQMPKIDVARLIALRSKPKPSENPPETVRTPSNDGEDRRNSGGIVRDLEVQISNALVPVDFHVLDIKLNWNSSLLLGRAFLSTVGAVCNLQTNQLCLILIDPNAHYDPIPVKKPQMSSRRINDPGIIAACHWNTRQNTQRRSKLTLQYRSIVAIRN
ncbi:hypothetical protein DY000_02007740 [Brassica cretica]|uniref:Reverse transcriptase domain-containing protein n=1 Tax=Brassica cretica TaxID=69181 RepID=A0ABQ7BTV6_BRACR|nr:hypothetical protein DY000_02007740 [Brassica cretica]